MSNRPLAAAVFLAVCLLTLISTAAPALAEVRLPDGEYYCAFDDLSVKVMGGHVSVSRSWFRNRWYFNSAWAPLGFAYDSLDGTVKTVERAGWQYQRTTPGVFVFDERNSIRATATGYRWQDRAGNFIDYDARGTIQAYGDRNEVQVRFRYEGDRVSAVLDNFGAQVLWYEWSGTQLMAVRDSTNRRVEYRYAGGRLTSVVDVLGNIWSYEYNGAGRLTALTDPEGRMRKIEYAANGRVGKLIAPDDTITQYGYDYDSAKREVYVRIVHPGGRTEERWYDLRANLRRHDVNGRALLALTADGRARIRTDENGAQVRDELDEWDNVVRRVNPDGTEEHFEYDSVYSNLLRYTDERGVVTQYDYDGKGNLTRLTEAAGLPEVRVTEYSYDAYGNLLRSRRLSDSVTLESVFDYEYDEHANLSRLVDPENGVTRYEYNVLGQVVTTTDARGKRWTGEYDAAGRLTAEADPLGNTNRYAYDKIGNAVSLTNARSQVTRLEYDVRDRLVSRIDAIGHAETQSYNAEGQLAQAVDRDQHAQRFEYDALGRLARHIDGQGNATQMEYSDPGGGEPAAFGPTRIIYPTFENQLRYDKRSRVVLDTDVDGEEGFVTRYRYDKRGQVDAVTDPAGHTTFYEYDALGRLTKATDRLGFAVAYAYDNRDNLIAVTDPEGGLFRMVYDRANRLLEERRPTGETARYAYDANDNLLEVTEPIGTRVAYGYDDAGRLTGAQHFAPAVAAAQSTYTFTYDALSNLTGWTTGEIGATLRYDALDRKVSETIDYGSFALTYGYGYTPGDLKQSLTYPDGTTVTYSYDAQSEVQSVELPGEGSITVNAFRWHAPTRITLPGGTTQEYAYDGRLQLTGLKVTNPAQQLVADLKNRYGRLQELADKEIDGGKTEYVYDDEVRLTQVNAPGGSETYTLDGLGNRTAQGSVAGNWQYDQNHRLRQRGGTSYDYDADGSLIQKAEAGRTNRFVYDVQRRLIRVEDAATGAVIARYGYDPFDRRLWKEAGGVRTYYLYADEGLIGEYNATGMALTTYGYLPDGPFSTDVLFVRSGSQTFYTHNDQLGTTLRLTDRAGNLVWAANYDAFGRARLAAGNTLTFNPRLPGQYFDAETGLHYNFRRTYDPDTGRYLTEDPIGLEGGINLYAYANGDPVNKMDPTGEIWWWAVEWGACFGACMLLNGIADYANGDCQAPPMDAKDCALTCVPIPFIPKLWGMAPKVWKWAKKWWPKRSPCNSFPGDTLVHTEEGLKPIKDIQVGDKVLAWAEWKDEYAYKPVTRVFTGEREYELVRITLENGEVVEATPNHPLYVSGEGWLAAQLVESGQQLDLKDNEEAIVIEAAREKRRERVFNLEIEASHTYIVSPAGIIAHNPTANRGGPPHGTAKPHGGVAHNGAIDRFIDRLYKWTSAANIRKNQTQVPHGSNTSLDRNRPDTQFDYKGKHYNFEWDKDPAASVRHHARVRLNDPASVIKCKILR